MFEYRTGYHTPLPNIFGVPKFQKLVTWSLYTTPFDLILHLVILLLVENVRAKFEVYSYCSRNIEGSKISKVCYVTHAPPLLTQFYRFCIVLPVFNLSVKLDANTLICDGVTDRWLLYDFANLAAKCIFEPILGSFGDFYPINCDIIVLTPNIRTSHEDTRFEILLVKIGSAVSSVALFKY